MNSFAVKGTAHILKPNALHYSPAIGLLTLSSPSFVANLNHFRSIDKENSSLIVPLFYQRRDEDGRRYGPISITNSRSQVAYWVRCQHIGSLVGLAIKHVNNDTLDTIYIDSILKDIGVECNYFHGQWTGISLSRYRKLIQLIANDLQIIFNNNAAFSPTTNYVMSLILRLVWEKAESKKCLLEFLIGIEKGSQTTILKDEYSDLRVAGSAMQELWLQDSFSLTNDLTTSRIQKASQVLISSYLGHQPTPTAGEDLNLSTGQALEHLAASIAYEKAFKNPIKLGKHSYGDGPEKPDCVEVVLREIVDVLLYDSERNAMRTEFLPDTASAKAKAFYFNICKSPSQPPNEKAFGKEWFDLCSELPGCSYLSHTSDLRHYELRPSMRNVSRALGLLLAGEQASWTSLRDLERYWNALHSPSHGSDGSSRSIRTTENVVHFRAPLSDTEKIYRDVGTLSAGGSSFEIHIELEEAHNLATVRFRRKDSFRSPWRENDLYSQFVSAWQLKNFNTKELPISAEVNLAVAMTQSALLSDSMIPALHRCLPDVAMSRAALLHALLSARWGEERNAVYIAASGEVSVTDGNITNSAAAAEKAAEALQFQQSFDVVLAAAKREVSSDKDDTTVDIYANIVVWLLSEAKQSNYPADEIAVFVLSLPDAVVGHHRVQHILNSSWPDKDFALIINSLKNVTHSGNKVELTVWQSLRSLVLRMKVKLLRR